MKRWRTFALALLIAAPAACADEAEQAMPLLSHPQASVLGDSTLGRLLFEQECSACHVGKSAFDLDHFNYPDTTIVRRATFHVDSASAWDIVAHVNSLASAADTMTRTDRPFQPGGVVLASDQAFAVQLFGSDAWPTSLTRDSLLAQDPTIVPVPLPLPVWSDESSTYDWLAGVPEEPLPAGVRAAAQNQFNNYFNNPSIETALILAKRLRNVAHDLSIPDAPCRYPNDVANFDAAKCRDVGKYNASLLYVEGIRSGDLHGSAMTSTKEWWETGHLVHKAQQHKKPLPDRSLLIAGWMHLGWMFDRSLNKQSSYETGALADLGYGRMAIWVALRTQVERPQGSVLACADAYVAALDGYANQQWLTDAIAFAYNEIEYRHYNNLLPANRAACADYIRRTQIEVGRKSPAAKDALQAQADSLSALITT
jgi:hypothetical protein